MRQELLDFVLKTDLERNSAGAGKLTVFVYVMHLLNPFHPIEPLSSYENLSY
jgi:hypothetical protein